MTGYIMDMDSDPDDEEVSIEGDGITDVSTTADEESADDDFSSLVSLTFPHITCDVGNLKPNAWEVEHEAHLNEVEGQDDILFAPEHEWQILHHLTFGVTQLTEDVMWQVITFGLGIADLGRRDARFSSGMEGELLDKVYQLWHDHAEHGTSEVFYVTPQPRLVGGPSVVLIVAVQYQEAQVDEPVGF